LNDDSTDNDSEIYSNLTENNKDNDQLLIDLIRSYPHLWDKQRKDYKDTTKKETSWEEISTILNQSSKYLILLIKNSLKSFCVFD
jgi:hypothetical protein